MSLTSPRNIVFEPDKGTYSESIRFKTSMFISVNNILNSEPTMQEYHYFVKYSVTLHGSDLQQVFENAMRYGKKMPIVQPLWAQSMVIVADSVSDTIHVDTTQWSDIKIATKVFIYTGLDSAEEAIVLEIQGGTVTLDREVSVQKGMLLLPTFVGYVKEGVNTKYANERLIQGEIHIEELK